METKHVSILILTLLLLSIPSIPISVQSAEAQDLSQDGVRIFIEKGPQEVFVNETAAYRVRIGGSFGKSADNWTLETSANIDAKIDSRTQESNQSNVFTVKVTVREKGNGKINFKAYCGKAGETRYSEDSYKIEAIKPVTTKVNVKNPTDTEISNVKVGLFVDGDLKNITKIDKLGADEQKTLTMNWSKKGYSSGKHEIEVWVDYNFEDGEKFTKDEVLLKDSFYIEGDSNLGLIAGIIIVAAVSGFLAYYFYSKGKSRRRKPWKK
ncbi:MAG: CARDB domain-containing protein [Thermoplasmatota archaeon]